LCLEGALEAGVNVNWTPSEGLAISALGQIYAQPSLRFDLNAFVLAEADLLLTTIALYREDWNLASVEIGSGYRVGIRFPVEYREGDPFHISLHDVEFIYPQINVVDTIRGLIA
jgi:hypothetical protein